MKDDIEALVREIYRLTWVDGQNSKEEIRTTVEAFADVHNIDLIVGEPWNDDSIFMGKDWLKESDAIVKDLCDDLERVIRGLLDWCDEDDDDD